MRRLGRIFGFRASFSAAGVPNLSESPRTFAEGEEGVVLFPCERQDYSAKQLQREVVTPRVVNDALKNPGRRP